MPNYYLDNEDLRFHVERGIDWGPLVELVEDGYQAPGGFRSKEEALDFYKSTLEAVGELVATRVAPHAAALDRGGPRLVGGEVVHPPELDRIMDEIRAMELHGICLPRELGGSGAPMLVSSMMNELFARADVSVMAHTGFHGGIALSLMLFSLLEGSTTYDRAQHKIVATRFEKEIKEILRGEAWGSMDITEPHAGSDMAALSTKAELGEDGVWRVTGQKIFITSGHAKYHIVIARTEPARSAMGLDGLSLFLVPAYEDLPGGGRRRIVTIDRLEEKLGMHGSVTASLSFEQAPAQLIGKRGGGFKLMLLLMNGARVSVGFEALGLAESAFRLAKAYASERPSMGKTIDRHEMIADYLDEMETDIRALRALGVVAAYHEEMHERLKRKLLIQVEHGSLEAERVKREMRHHESISRRLTPLLKYAASEKGVEIARRAIQIHGGAGYIVEYGAERLLRDAMVMPIYEGTSQIQALMAMKDTLGGIMKNPQAFLTSVAQARWRGLSARDPLDKRVAKLQVLSLGAQQFLLSRTATDKLRSVAQEPVKRWPEKLTKNWDPKRDFALAMLHAERLTKLLCDQAIAEVLLDHAARHPDRRELLERFLDRAEPRARTTHEEITTTGHRVLAKLGANEANATRGFSA